MQSSWTKLLREVADWLRSERLLTRGAHWVVGVSGGPDSTLLLHLLHTLAVRDEWNLFRDVRLHAAHLHHGLRGVEAERDWLYVHEFAERRGVLLFSDWIDVPAEAAATGGSLETVGRRERYAFLERVAVKTRSKVIAVGHHADDNAETILHRLCRGTGLRGLSGMKRVRPLREGSAIRLVRPLLPYRREQIEAWCEEQQLHPRHDATNTCTTYTRARIRHAVLPMLRETLNPKVVEALLRLAAQAEQGAVLVEKLAAEAYKRLCCVTSPDRVELDAVKLARRNPLVQTEVVRRALAAVAGTERDPSFPRLEAVRKLAALSGTREVHWPGGLVVQRSGGRLVFRRPSSAVEIAPGEPLPVEVPGRTALWDWDVELVAEVKPWEPSQTLSDNWRNPREAWLDADRVRLPLGVRACQPGDRFRPLGAPGSKRVSEFLGDAKICAEERVRTVLVCDQDGPLWVVPVRIDERVKLRPGTTRVLRLQLEPKISASDDDR